MSDTGLILVVDDDPTLISAHSLFVQSLGFGVLTATNGQEALDLIRERQDEVGLVLADVRMPVMDGYQLCKALKSEPETAEIPVLFVTALDTLEEKLKGFDAGAEDYITKPITPKVLERKLKALMERRAKNRALQQQLNETRSVAMQAMTYAGDLGQVLEFYKNTLNANSFEALATLLFEVTNSYDLHCSLQIITPTNVLNFSCLGKASPLEVDVINMARNKGRFFDFGNRTLINYNEFALLAKNMPVDNPERYGIIKDSLGNLCNAIEARVKFLLHQDDSLQKEQILSSVRGVLEQIDEVLKRRKSSVEDGQVLSGLFEQVRNQLDQVFAKGA